MQLNNKYFPSNYTPVLIQNVDVKRPSTANIERSIEYKFNVTRSKQNFLTWKNAVIAAENFLIPQRYQLLQNYMQIEIDAHLTAVVQQRKNMTLCKEFEVIGKNGERDDVKTELIRKKWFRDYLDLSLDSIYWGYSLIQFGDVENDEFTTVELVPRQFVKQEFHVVAPNWTAITGKDYLKAPYKNWCIGVGKVKDLGLYMKAAPLVLWKQSALGAWAEYQEVFGAPLRLGKTNLLDHETRKNMENMISGMGTSTWAVVDKEDEVEFVATSKQDAYEVFSAMIEVVNKELSKLILGQTGTTDEKAFVGGAEVHERIAESYGYNDEFFIHGVNNYQLLPLLIYHGILSEGDTIRVEKSDDLAFEEKIKVAIELVKTGKYVMTPEYIAENWDIEVEAVETPDPVKVEKENIKNFEAKLKEVYG